MYIKGFMKTLWLILTLSIMLAVLFAPIDAFNTSSGSIMGVRGPLNGGITEIIIYDPDAAFDALLTGQIDQLELVRPDQIDRARSAGFVVTREFIKEAFYIWFNFGRNITNNLGFRKAVAHMIPKDRIIAIYLGPLAERGVTFLGPAWGIWNNKDIEDPEYDPEYANYLLNKAGYVLNQATGVRIDPATGRDMRTLEFVYAPDSDVTTNNIIQTIVEEMNALGIPVKMIPAPLATGEWYQRVFSGNWDFIAAEFSVSGDFPAIMYYHLHSSRPPTFLNFPRYSNPEFDTAAEILISTLNMTEALRAAWKCQEIIANDVVLIPLYYSVRYTAYNPEWVGMIEGSYDTLIELMRIHHKSGDTSKIFRICRNTEAASGIPGFDLGIAVYRDQYVKHTILLENHPIEGYYLPWIAKKWIIEEWSDPELGVTRGSKITVTIVEGLKWHDGFDFTVDDIVFSIQYMKDKQVPRGSTTVQNFIKAEVVNSTTAILYYSTASLFVGRSGSYTPVFPKHIYNDNVTRYGEPAGPIGLQFPNKYGVPDPSTFAAFDVPNPYNSSLTCYVGIGPYIYLPGGWRKGTSFTVVANRNYFKTILVSDVNFDFKVDLNDLETVAKVFWTKSGQSKFTVTVDMNGDGKINIYDLFAIAKDFGKTW